MPMSERFTHTPRANGESSDERAQTRILARPLLVLLTTKLDVNESHALIHNVLTEGVQLPFSFFQLLF